MTHEELEKIFGDKLKPIEVKLPIPKKYDGPAFDQFALYFSTDFRTIISVPAAVGEFVSVEKHGVIPPSDEYLEKISKLPADERPFNCIIGDYTEIEAPVFFKDAFDYCDVFNARRDLEYKDDIYASYVIKSSYNKLCPVRDYHRNIIGYYGIFSSKDIAEQAFISKKNDILNRLSGDLATINNAKIN